jgi:crotonobetainyl-CoA:carnitine CoA-transferase CaiB-like acyl-CoA transferase
MTRGPLSHLSVLELGDGHAVEYCGKLLATYGARVIKLEPPDAGVRTRSLGPFIGKAGSETSVPFLWLNTGKESVACDLQATAGQELARRLALNADIVIEAFAPGALARMSLGYDTLSAERPRLVMTSITPFGQTGPYRDYLGAESVGYATGGGMHLTGDGTREPLAAGVPVASQTAGMAAYAGTLMAVFAAARSGKGDHVDVSVQEAMLDNVEIAMVEHLHTGRVARRTGDRHNLVPWRLFPCRDGWVAAIGGPVRKWLGALDMFDDPRFGDQQFRHIAGRIEHRDEFEGLLQSWLETRDRDDVLAAARERGLAFAGLNRPEEVLVNAQNAARRFFRAVDHPVAGEQIMAGEPWRFGEARMEERRAPLLGEHTARVLLEDLEVSPSELQALLAGRVIAQHEGV